MTVTWVRAAAAALLVAATVTGCASESPSPTADTGEPESSATPTDELLWADEFDGPEGRRPDDAVWVTQTGNLDDEGWGNNELQFYTDAPENSSLDGDGHLVIAALPAEPDADLPCVTVPSCPYTSARLTTEGTVALETGRVEVRARIPNGTGLLPAIWMLGNNGETWPAQGEIDVAEVVGGEPDTVYGTAHGPSYFNEDGIGAAFDLGEPSGDEFHVYAVDKRPEAITWSVDGEDYLTLTPDDLPDPGDWVFEQDMHVLLNVAAGGDWPGSPDASTTFPAEMVVDYVRIFGS
ncbi:glycosyl hydrolase family 16 [Labedella gwakjiensis]|uniref:Glycoside hydrolase family 16 protein n=1 Tax=Labedella gwakjiensis TaxID=390269 RepID=A0A2P8GTS9_9MICO|nr:glycoside hydrolase family 16 protein [Labedella gwakjiensis]PSL37355.1 glycosyl hydrolase family 16 [Labedella gwakjiensis]RUQ84676.1 glycoside hydrolase family 16 protein [Labedella gwakjiensis]